MKLDLAEESSGTRRVLELMPMMCSMETDDDILWFVNVMDRGLYSLLTQYLVSRFRDKAARRKNRLVFAAQDVSFMSLEIMSQEEMWFIEKKTNGVSDLYPMTSFQLRSGQDTQRLTCWADLARCRQYRICRIAMHLVQSRETNAHENNYSQ